MREVKEFTQEYTANVVALFRTASCHLIVLDNKK